MKKVILFILIFSLCSPTLTNNSTYSNVKPVKKFNIGYYENDPYFNYAGTLYGIIKGFHKMGYIKTLENIPYASGSDDAYKLWKWLEDNNSSTSLLNFKSANFINLSNVIDSQKPSELKKIIKNNNIDLLITMGTKAGKLASQNIDDIPVLVFSCSDAIKAGIISSVKDSGKNNVWAHVDPTRYIRQLNVFYDLFKFKKLGVVYENTELGRNVAAIDTIRVFAKAHKFKLVEYYVEESKSLSDNSRYEKELNEAYSKISKEVDAFYLTPGTRVLNNTYSYLQPFYKNKIPVFSQVGPIEVQYGALMSVYRYNYDEIGSFGANRIVKIINGSKPRYLSPIFDDTPSISVNTQVAKNIDYKFPFEILLVSDIVYNNILK